MNMGNVHKQVLFHIPPVIIYRVCHGFGQMKGDDCFWVSLQDVVVCWAEAAWAAAVGIIFYLKPL